MTFLDALVSAIKKAADYNPDDQTAPAAVLWPDAERQWEPLTGLLREHLPILTLGEYKPEARTGPAYWIRCMIERTISEDLIPDGQMAVVYMPGVSKQDIRAVEDCPKSLQPLAELQYRGCLFTQKNGRDWTIAAFLQSKDGGLGIETGADQATGAAIKRARHKLPMVSLDSMRKSAPLRAAFFDDLLTPDVGRDFLQWLDDTTGYSEMSTKEEWESFVAQCRHTYGLDPGASGPIEAAKQLGLRETDAWDLVWQRFAEAPEIYPNIPGRLRAARPGGDLGLFARPESWPQDNEEAEKALRSRLRGLEEAQPAQARKEIEDLERDHKNRRSRVWARLRKAPLAMAVGHLASVARLTATALTGKDTTAIAREYAEWGWRADDAVLRSLAEVETTQDKAAVRSAVRAVYRPWLEDAARGFQAAVANADIDTAYPLKPSELWPEGTCLLFSDGLRFDVAQRLMVELEAGGLSTKIDFQFAALPGITATSKPAVSPAEDRLTGGPELSPTVIAGGSTVDLAVLRKQIELEGHQVLLDDDYGDPNGRAWTELGDIDNIGHVQTPKLPILIDGEVRNLSERISSLLGWGWGQVVVVTDHGWLLMPGGLPKAELPQHLTAGSKMRKGRCARLKDMAQTDLQIVPWHWDDNVRVAMAPGICCFQSGKSYEHGGLSPQECVTPVVTVTGDTGSGTDPCSVVVKWLGMRCNFDVLNAPESAMADLRTKAGDPASSLVSKPLPVEQHGTVRLLVEDDDMLEHAAFAVVLGADGQIVAQVPTTVGGDG